jgi:hypothetical protein
MARSKQSTLYGTDRYYTLMFITDHWKCMQACQSNQMKSNRRKIVKEMEWNSSTLLFQFPPQIVSGVSCVDGWTVFSSRVVPTTGRGRECVIAIALPCSGLWLASHIPVFLWRYDMIWYEQRWDENLKRHKVIWLKPVLAALCTQ